MEVLALRSVHEVLSEEAAAVLQGLTCGEVAVVVALEAPCYGLAVLEEQTPFAPLGKVEAPQTGVDCHPWESLEVVVGEEAQGSRPMTLAVGREEGAHSCAQICQHLQLEAALGIWAAAGMVREWMQATLPLLQHEFFVTVEVVAERLVDYPYYYLYVAGL